MQNTFLQSIISLYLIIVLCIAESITASAKESEAIIKEDINSLNRGLKYILNEQKESAVEEIKSEIINNNWDYNATVSSIGESDPFKDVDYISLLSAYMTVKNHSSEKGQSDFTYLSHLPLVQCDTEELEKEEFIPTKISTYSNVYGTNKYIREGTRYVTEKTVLDRYELHDDGFFYKEGTETIIPETKNIRYGSVTFSVMTADDIFSYYGLDQNLYADEFKQRINRLSLTTNNLGIYQAMFANFPQMQIHDLNIKGYSSLPATRQIVAEVANSLTGNVPYLWGGKANKPGYDTSWWLYDENNNQKGLDCSGYVQWVYWTAGFPESMYQQMLSTTSIINSDFKEINQEELQVGDIGIKIGPEVNHAGIYIGEIDGKKQWIHCAANQGTVVISEFDFYKYYSPLAEYEMNDKKPDNNDTISLDNHSVIVYATNTESHVYSDEDVYMLSQLIVHEAGGEGFNGWVAVAEVVKNRINSPLFPNTLKEVVYEKGQFSYVEEIADIEPPQEIINVAQAVLEGQLCIFNKPTCLHFKNPMITDGIKATEPVDWGNLRYYTNVGNHAFYLNEN